MGEDTRGQGVELTVSGRGFRGKGGKVKDLGFRGQGSKSRNYCAGLVFRVKG